MRTELKKMRRGRWKKHECRDARKKGRQKAEEVIVGAENYKWMKMMETVKKR